MLGRHRLQLLGLWGCEGEEQKAWGRVTRGVRCYAALAAKPGVPHSSPNPAWWQCLGLLAVVLDKESSIQLRHINNQRSAATQLLAWPRMKPSLVLDK